VCAGDARTLARLETPRGAMTISACGDGNPRTRRLKSPHATFLLQHKKAFPPVFGKAQKKPLRIAERLSQL